MRTFIHIVTRWLSTRLAALRAAPTPPAPHTKRRPTAPAGDDPWVMADGRPIERLSPWD